jgi:DNA-binding transcriptional regulator GbsR (MarR family)
MGQFDILELLKRNPNKWFTVGEIAEGLNIENSSVSLNCKQLRKHDVVNYKVEKRTTHIATQLVYQHKPQKRKNEKTRR